MEYVIVTADTILDLEKGVISYIEDGWTPLGGPFSCLTSVYKNFYVAQAMIKEDN